MSSVADEFVDELGEAIGLTFLGGSFADRRRALDDASVAAVWLCGLEHARRMDAGGWPYVAVAAPVMAEARYARRAVYFGDVLVADSSDMDSLDDLEGRHLVINEADSLSGRWMLSAAMGSLDGFASVAESGSHLESLSMLQRGEADVACIDSTVREMARHRHADDFGGLRRIASLGPYPAPPLVASPTIATRVRRSLTSLHENTAGKNLLRAWGVERFLAVDDEPYRRLADVTDRSSAHS